MFLIEKLLVSYTILAVSKYLIASLFNNKNDPYKPLLSFLNELEF